jgi:hypothetical protein
MKALILRALAALCLLASAHSARAVIITFNPATTATFLDVTLDASDGVLGFFLAQHPIAPVIWGIGGDLAEFSGGVSVGWTDGEKAFGFDWDADLIGGLYIYEGTRGIGWATWNIANPVTHRSGFTNRITWDVTPIGVPDTGATLALLGFAALLFSAFHRFSDGVRAARGCR